MSYHHGMKGTRGHRAWSNMKNRCFNPNGEKYKNYGARGITVCERWLDFRNFFADMGQPLAATSLERKDNDGDYEPDNCEWATVGEQNANRTRGVVVHGVKMTKKAASVRLGLHPRTVYERLRRGWSIEDAISVSAGG